MGLAHLKSHDFMASSLMFQCAVLAYNTMRWMALLSGHKGLQHWGDPDHPNVPDTHGGTTLARRQSTQGEVTG